MPWLRFERTIFSPFITLAYTISGLSTQLKFLIALSRKQSRETKGIWITEVLSIQSYIQEQYFTESSHNAQFTKSTQQCNEYAN